MDLWFYGKGLRRRATLSQPIKIPYELVRARAQRSDRSSKSKRFDPIKPECRVNRLGNESQVADHLAELTFL
jgi:hypothetical protein